MSTAAEGVTLGFIGATGRGPTMTLFGAPERVTFTLTVGVTLHTGELLTHVECHDTVTGDLIAITSRPGRIRRQLGPELARTLNMVLELVADLEGASPPAPSR